MCHVELTFVDIVTGNGDPIKLGDTDVTVARTNITIDSQLLTSNWWYRVIIAASNIGGHATSQERISKFI